MKRKRNEAEKKTLGSLLARIVAQQRITPGVHPTYRQMGSSETAQAAFVTKLSRDSTGVIQIADIKAAGLAGNEQLEVRLELDP